jgi:serine/threonine protein kinase
MTDELQRLSTAVADHYRIESVVGRGGMATVYLAHDVRHSRKVAVKVLRGDLAAVLGADRFLHEIRVTANLQHPHILPLHDSGVADELLYYVMPFVVGESLRARMNREGPFDFPTTLAIAEEVADALSYAHRQHVVHRDVKPENVLLSEGHALVTDFGIAKAVTTASDEPLTRTGFALGTPGYMSPEQAAGGQDVNERSDIFSLACVIYEMLVGAVPLRWISHDEREQGRFLKAPPVHRARLAELPSSVERALVRAMTIDPDARFRTPNELFRALTAPGPPKRRYSETEAKDILRKAASLEATEPTQGGDFSLTGVKRIAGEVDIPSRHVAAAAGALDQPVLRTPRILGIPAGMQVGRTVPGEVPEAEFPVLLEIVQESLGDPGQIESAYGRVFAWTSGTGQAARSAGRMTRVQVSPRSGSTKITITEDQTATIAIGVSLGLVVVAGIALPAARMGVTAMLPAVAIVVTGGVFALRAHWKRRRQLLESLLQRLTGHVTSTARGMLPGGGER